MHRMLAVLLCLSGMLPLRAGADTGALTALEQKTDAALAQSLQRWPAYAVLVRDIPEFKNQWRAQVRRQLIVGKTRPSTLSDAVALSMALNAIGAYWLPAEDTAVDALFQQQRRLLVMAQTDARLCGLLLNTVTARADADGQMPWLLQKPYRREIPALQNAVSDLILNGQGKPARLLPEDLEQLFLQRMAVQMKERFGSKALDDFQSVQNDNAAPAIRCRGLHQMLETLATQPLELRAQLMRSTFGRN